MRDNSAEIYIELLFKQLSLALQRAIALSAPRHGQDAMTIETAEAETVRARETIENDALSDKTTSEAMRRLVEAARKLLADRPR